MSQAPVWEAQARPHRLGARAMGLRVFVCASPNGYMAMPGGLARVATGPDDGQIAIGQQPDVIALRRHVGNVQDLAGLQVVLPERGVVSYNFV